MSSAMRRLLSSAIARPVTRINITGARLLSANAAAAPKKAQPVVPTAQAVKLAALFPENSIYKRETDIFRDVDVSEMEGKHANPEWRKAVNQLFKAHRPSKHPFFDALATAPVEVVTNPGWLAEFYVRYQTAMHSTRAAVYFAPRLNTPSLRQRKIGIISDDDSQDKLSHHKQLEAMFQRMGAAPIKPCDWFACGSEMIEKVDPKTAEFVRVVDSLYRQDTGAWCIAEVLSDDWLSALAHSFKPVFPFVMTEQYFDEIFSGHVEIVHMMETVSITEEILAKYPHLLKQTIDNATSMAKNLDGLWDNLHSLVLNPKPYLSKVTKA